MFVCNVSLNKSKIFKIIIYIVIAAIIISAIFGIYSLVNKSKKNFVDDCEVRSADVTEIPAENYTNILKSCHENIDLYLGKKIKFSGFVYRLYDFNENQFVLGREMIVSQTSQTQAQAVVVGFLCNSEESSRFADGTWIEIEGTITKGYYHSELPMLEITKINEASAPENPYVYPPDEGYVETEKL